MTSPRPLDDHQLLALIQSGNADACRRAQDELLSDQRYLAFVQRMVRRRLEARQMLFPDQANYRADAEWDVLADLFEAVYSVEQLPRNVQRGKGFDPAQGTLRNWLWRQADFRTRDWIRRELRTNDSDRQTEAAHDIATETLSPDPPAPGVSRADFHRFHQALDQLTPTEHACVLLRYLPYLRLEPPQPASPPQSASPSDTQETSQPASQHDLPSPSIPRSAHDLPLALRAHDVQVLARVSERGAADVLIRVDALNQDLERRWQRDPTAFERLARCEARVQLLHQKQSGYRRDGLFYRGRLQAAGASEDQLAAWEQSAVPRTVEQIWQAHGRRHTDACHYELCCHHLARTQRQLSDARENLARAEDRVCPTSDDIGQFLGKPKSAVDPPLSRGRKKLREILQDEKK